MMLMARKVTPRPDSPYVLWSSSIPPRPATGLARLQSRKGFLWQVAYCLLLVGGWFTSPPLTRRLISSSACGGANVYDEVFLLKKKKKQNKNPETINTIMNTSKEKKTKRKRKRKRKGYGTFSLARGLDDSLSVFHLSSLFFSPRVTSNCGLASCNFHSYTTVQVRAFS